MSSGANPSNLDMSQESHAEDVMRDLEEQSLRGDEGYAMDPSDVLWKDVLRETSCLPTMIENISVNTSEGFFKTLEKTVWKWSSMTILKLLISANCQAMNPCVFQILLTAKAAARNSPP